MNINLSTYQINIFMIKKSQINDFKRNIFHNKNL